MEKIIVDTYGKMGLVLMLPHGYEGYAIGAEHSSARLMERYHMGRKPEIQLMCKRLICIKELLINANCISPANLFHILRKTKL